MNKPLLADIITRLPSNLIGARLRLKLTTALTRSQTDVLMALERNLLYTLSDRAKRYLLTHLDDPHLYEDLAPLLRNALARSTSRKARSRISRHVTPPRTPLTF